MRLQEEQSRDRETNHTNEVLGVIAMPFGSYWANSSRSVDEQVAREPRPRRPVAPPVDPVAGLGSCRDYSERAVAQFNRSRRNSCSFIGANWHGNAQRHRRWCRRNGLRAANRFIVRHRAQLRNCLDRADNRPIQESEWVRVGCAKAAFKKDVDVIRLKRSNGRFTSLMLKAGKARMTIYEARVTFGNGASQVLSYRGRLDSGDSTGPLDLKGGRRFISSIRLSHKARLSFPPKKGTVCVFGKR